MMLSEIIPDDHEYYIHHGDCIPHMWEQMPEASMDFAVFSPPFPSLYAYTSLPEDIGNSEDIRTEARIHLGYFYRALARVMRPGRVIVVHVMQIPGFARNQERGTHDFRGLNIRLGERAGLHYQYDWLVTKNPQAQAIRTHSNKLLFVSLERDRVVSCGAFGDYLIKFLVPGDNCTPIDSSEISRNEWINWAEAAWTDIRTTETLNVAEGRGKDDTKHICPLQLGVINRLVRLFSNPGEIVFSPFAGIGSEGYVALGLDRRFYGCEIKPEYYAASLRNCDRAIANRKKAQQESLF